MDDADALETMSYTMKKRSGMDKVESLSCVMV